MIRLSEAQITDNGPGGSLQLFVAGQTGVARAVETDIRKVLQEEIGSDHLLEVIDVIKHPERAERENVSLTPALIYHGFDRPRRLVGAINRREQILWLIDWAPVSKRTAPLTAEDALAELCPDGLVLMSEDGLIHHANPVACAWLGLSDTAPQSAHFAFPIVIGDATVITLPNGRPIEMQCSGTEWNGTKAVLAVLRNPSGQSPELVKTNPTDNTSQLNAEIEHLRKIVAQSNKALTSMRDTGTRLEKINRELSDFAYRAAHDSIAPIRSAETLLDFAIDEVKDNGNAEALGLLKNARGAISRVITLSENLLAYSKAIRSTLDVQPIELNGVIKWVLNDLKAELTRVEGTCNVGSLPTVSGDQGLLYQIFTNLISNAIKYRRPDTDLRISINSTRSTGPDGAPFASIVIEDNGRGFDPVYNEKIFQPFERLVSNSAVEGSGIGLSIVQRLVEHHGGTVSATAHPGLGARFTVELPLWTKSGQAASI